jgi:F-type H+-transporting ATPase subunit c
MKKVSLFSVVMGLILPMLLFSISAIAADGSAAGGGDRFLFAAGAVLGVGLAAAGGGIGQGLIGNGAMEGISRNPSALDKIFTPMILVIAFVESLVIFTIVTIFLVK